MKTFHIFQAPLIDGREPSFEFRETIIGTISEARSTLDSPAYNPGRYVILEDTSGFLTKSVVTTQKVTVTFEPSRKKPRKQLTPEQIAAKTKKVAEKKAKK
jgi:hypothetical protein